MAQMPEATKQILEDVSYFKDKYYTFDEPVPFKDGLVIYPVSVRDYNEFLSCSVCLTLNKNDTPEGIRMTNIDYLVSKMKDPNEGPLWSLRFTRILELCLHIKSGLRCPKCGKFMSFEEFYQKYEDPNIEDKNSVLDCECGGKFEETVKFAPDEDDPRKKTGFIFNGVKVNGTEFNKLRHYIMHQNLPDYHDDSWVDKAIRDDQAARAEIKGRNMGTASLERKIIGLKVNTNMTFEEVYNLSMRKFLMLLSMIDDVIDYKITRQALASGFSSLPKGETISHWLYKKDEGMYGKAIDADAYKSQIQNA